MAAVCVAVESTSLATVSYDAERRVLRLQFRDRRIYEYLGVPPHVHDELMCAQSKGGYFNRFIRNRFPYTLVPGSPS